MTKIFADAEEKFVKTVALYGHSDNYLYVDESHAEKIDKDTLLDLCLKGMAVINYESAYYTPVLFKENSGAIEVVIATSIGTGTSTSVTLYSKEHFD